MKKTNVVANFHPSDHAYTELLNRDLVMNIYRNGQWGSFRHITEGLRKYSCSCIAVLSPLTLHTGGNVHSSEPARFRDNCLRTQV